VTIAFGSDPGIINVGTLPVNNPAAAMGADRLGERNDVRAERKRVGRGRAKEGTGVAVETAVCVGLGVFVDRMVGVFVGELVGVFAGGLIGVADATVTGAELFRVEVGVTNRAEAGVRVGTLVCVTNRKGVRVGGAAFAICSNANETKNSTHAASAIPIKGLEIFKLNMVCLLCENCRIVFAIQL
jgi:hypothetical protein